MELNVGIGTTTPGEKLSVSGNINASGSINANAGLDIAESFPSVDGLEPGDIVSINREGKLVKTSKAYDALAIGVISEKPGITLGSKTNKVTAPLALAGRVPVKISLENGAIMPGDLLTTSSQPGIAMKATQPGRVIGVALESYNGQPITQCTNLSSEETLTKEKTQQECNQEDNCSQEPDESAESSEELTEPSLKKNPREESGSHEDGKVMTFINPHWAVPAVTAGIQSTMLTNLSVNDTNVSINLTINQTVNITINETAVNESLPSNETNITEPVNESTTEEPEQEQPQVNVTLTQEQVAELLARIDALEQKVLELQDKVAEPVLINLSQPENVTEEPTTNQTEPINESDINITEPINESEEVNITPGNLTVPPENMTINDTFINESPDVSQPDPSLQTGPTNESLTNVTEPLNQTNSTSGRWYNIVNTMTATITSSGLINYLALFLLI